MKQPISRRSALQRAALAASALPLVATAQAPQGGQAPAGAPAGARGGRGGGGGNISGGRGPIKVLLVTKGHPFNYLPFFQFFDSLGTDITWTHVEQPAASAFFDPALAKPFDVFVHYDWADRTMVNSPQDPPPQPPAQLQRNFRDLLRQGKGFVFFHHALAAWSHTWPEYSEVMGGAADWGKPMVQRGKDYPKSGFRGKMHQKITVVDKNHPITQGVADFEIVDETYLCPMFTDSFHVLTTTDFDPKVASFPSQSQDPNWKHPDGPNCTSWVKTAENSPIAYIQHGHDEEAWGNPGFKMLMGNAIKWAASKEAMDWAKKNPTKIFKG